MFSAIAVAALAALTPLASAAKCTNLTIPITISARNGAFNITNPTTNIAATNFILNLSRQGHNYTNEVTTGFNTVSGSYNIAATYCEPDAGPAKTVQLLTHGIGFDRSYWDFSYANYNYSYVREAVDQYGYSTFSWDRLGIGMSSHGDPVSEIQLPLEVAALRALTIGLRNGTISGISTPYNKVVHVGHSFGSSQTYALTAMYPSLSDGAVLTGFSNNGTFAAFFELGSDFVIANTNPALASYATGYLAPASATGVQIDFFAPGDFDPAVLATAYATGQPVTPGELLTLAGLSASVNTFPKPVLVITGGKSLIPTKTSNHNIELT